MESKKVWISGKWQDSSSGETFEVANPAANEVIALVESGNADDIDRAVRAARESFEEGPWGRMSGVERGQILKRAAAIINERTEELARLETLDTGKPITESLTIDIPASATALDYYGGMACDLKGDVISVAGGDFLDYAVHEFLGVVGVIIP